jgi:hypothetical protein
MHPAAHTAIALPHTKQSTKQRRTALGRYPSTGAPPSAASAPHTSPGLGPPLLLTALPGACCNASSAPAQPVTQPMDAAAHCAAAKRSRPAALRRGGPLPPLAAGRLARHARRAPVRRGRAGARRVRGRPGFQHRWTPPPPRAWRRPRLAGPPEQPQPAGAGCAVSRARHTRGARAQATPRWRRRIAWARPGAWSAWTSRTACTAARSARRARRG